MLVISKVFSYLIDKNKERKFNLKLIKNKNELLEFVYAGFLHNSQNIHLAVNFTLGKYYLYLLCRFWGEKHYDYNATSYAN